MAKTYEVNGTTRVVNQIISSLIRFGIMPQKMHILTVRGRKSGKLYHAPVSIVTENGVRYLVSPYGEVSWVKNARANGEVTLTRGGKTESLHIKQLPPSAAAPLLKTYLQRETLTRPYFASAPDAPVESFVAEAEEHPVFELVS